jgi:hypothetical protein
VSSVAHHKLMRQLASTSAPAAAPSMPEPRFDLGDRVMHDDGTAKGEVVEIHVRGGAHSRVSYVVRDKRGSFARGDEASWKTARGR